MKKSNNPLSVLSKELLMTALLELLVKKPYNQITITEISSQAQLARRTFYRNFDTKEDILNLYIQKLISEYIELLGQEDTLKIYNVARVYFTFWNKHLDFLILMEKNNLLYMLLEKYNKYLPIIHNKFKKNKEDSLNNNVLEYILAFSAGGFWNTLIKWVHEGAKKTPDQMAALVHMIVNDTILE